MQRVERHIIKKDENIDELCFLSKNLYNTCNFILRQVYFGKFEKIQEYQDLIKSFKWKDQTFYKIDEYDLSKRLVKLKQKDYNLLPSQSAQQVIKILYKNWNAYFKSLKIYYKNKDKFSGKPKIPKYKDKTKGRNLVIFTDKKNFKSGFVQFPKKTKISPIKTKVKKVDQVRIIPQANCYVIEIIYTKEVQEHPELNPNSYLAIDPGLNNLATCVNNIGLQPFIINGRIVKSMNQYYNKKQAELQSFVGSKGTSKRLKSLTLKRNNKIQDYFHKSSRFIINYCLKNKIKTIVIGKNKGWKDGINLGSKTNQNFVSIPFCKLIQQLKYKGEEVQIEVLEQEESYTSKCSFLDQEELRHQENYLGKRIHRGQFRSSSGKLLNSDVNGAYNIMRKVIPTIFNDQGIEGLVLNPVIVKDYKQEKF